MTLAIYPTIRGLTWPINRVPEFSTLEPMGSAGYRNTVPLYQNPLWHWDLKYGYLNDDPANILAGNTDTDYRTLLGFFVALKGPATQFLYLDPADHINGPALIPGGSTPNLNCELQLLQDSGSGLWYSPIQRNLGGTNINGFEDITDLVAGTLQVYGNGSLIGGSYPLVGPGFTVAGESFEGLVIAWPGSPPATPVTAQFQFYFRCAWEKDDDFETDWIFAEPNRFQSKSVKIKSVRAASQV